MEVNRDEIMDMLAQELECEPMREDEFTTEMFAKKTNYSTNGAAAFLKKKVDAGILTVRQVRTGRAWANVFRKKEELINET